VIHAKGIGQREPLNHWGQWRIDAVLNGLAHQGLDEIKAIDWDSQDIASLVINAEQQSAAGSAVGEGSELISQVVLGRATYRGTGKANLFAFQEAVFSQAELCDQFISAQSHLTPPARAWPIGGPVPRARLPSQRKLAPESRSPEGLRSRAHNIDHSRSPSPSPAQHLH
jgi:hypothetical protein